MIARFCLYSVLKNLRFADPFVAIYFIELGFSYAEIGALLGFQRLVTAVLEVPLGIGADRWGRRTVLASSFAAHAVGLSILGMATVAASSPGLAWFYMGLGVYGFGEALRTGGHKAIMLDYLEMNGQADRATWLLSVTRTFSKLSAALAGLAAGALLYLVGDYGLLFWTSSASAAAGFALIMSYPKYLEGESRRERLAASPSFDLVQQKLSTMLKNARLWRVMLPSVIYESQVEIVLKLFLQPFLHTGLAAAGMPVAPVEGSLSAGRGGSLIVGVNELFRDGLGAIGARNSVRIEQKLASRSRGLLAIYALTLATVLLLTVAAMDVERMFWFGLLAVGVVTMLQNLRRPMYSALLNEVANKPLRATIFSIDHQAMSLTTAALMPLCGLAADRWGLWTICLLSASLMAAGLLLESQRSRGS